MSTPLVDYTHSKAFDSRLIHHDASSAAGGFQPLPSTHRPISVNTPDVDLDSDSVLDVLNFKVSCHDTPDLARDNAPQKSAVDCSRSIAPDFKTNVLDSVPESPALNCDAAVGRGGELKLPFPVEILHQVGSCGVLAPSDLLRMSRASKGMHRVFTDDYVWHALAVHTGLVPSFKMSLLEASERADVRPRPKTWFAFAVFLEMIEWQFGWNILGEKIHPWHIEESLVGYSGPNQRAQLGYTRPEVWGLDTPNPLFAFFNVADDKSYYFGDNWQPPKPLTIIQEDMQAGKLLWHHKIKWNETVGNQIMVLEVAKSPRWLVCLMRWQSQDGSYKERYWADVYKIFREDGTRFKLREIVVFEGDIPNEWDDDAGKLDSWQPVIVGDEVLILDQHRLIHTYNLETGEKVANFPFYKHLAQNPSIQMNLNLDDFIDVEVSGDGEVIFLVAGAGSLIALDAQTGTKLWSFRDMVTRPHEYGLAQNRIGTYIMNPSNPLDPIPSLRKYELDMRYDISPLRAMVDPVTETLVVYTTSCMSRDSHIWILKNYKSVIRRNPSVSAWLAGVWECPERACSMWFGAPCNGRLFMPFLVPGWSLVVSRTTEDGQYPAPQGYPEELKQDTGRYTRTTPPALPWDQIREWGMLSPVLLDWRHASSPDELEIAALPAGPVDQESQRVLFPGRLDTNGHPSIATGHSGAAGFLQGQRMPPYLSPRCAWLLIPAQHHYMDRSTAPSATVNMRWDWGQAATEWLRTQMQGE